MKAPYTAAFLGLKNDFVFQAYSFNNEAHQELQKAVEEAKEEGYQEKRMQANGRLACSYGRLPDFEEEVILLAYTEAGFPEIFRESASPLSENNRLASFAQMYEGEAWQTCNDEIIIATDEAFLVICLASRTILDDDQFSGFIQEAVEANVGPPNW